MNHRHTFRFSIFSFLLVMLVLASLLPVMAQVGEPIVLGQRVKFHSNIMNEDRTLLVYSPDTALASSGRYPVIYLLDGESQFLHTTGVVQFLSQNNRMPQMIVVGITNTNRTRDLTPQPADTSSPGSGGADTFLGFIKDELVPYIDSHYKTSPFRMLIGHSFGGIFAVNALLKHPDAFNAYIIVSPSLWWSRDTLVHQIDAFLKKAPTMRTFVYETIGNEGPGMVTPSLRVLQLIESHPVEGLQWKIKLMENEDHGSIVHRSIYDGLEFVFSSWQMRGNLMTAGIAGLEQHYRDLSKLYGYQIAVPELVVNGLGYQYFFQNKLDEAIAVFTWNVAHYPGSWNVYDSLGEAFAKKGDTRQAIENYEKSIVLNPNNTAGKATLQKLKAK